MPLTTFLEDLAEALLNPRDLAMVYNVEKRGMGTALATVLMMGALIGLGTTTPLTQIVHMIHPASWVGISSLITGFIIAGTMLASFTTWLAYGLLLYLGLKLVGGRGDLSTTLSMVGTSFIGLWPLAALPPVAWMLGGGVGGYLGAVFLGAFLGLLWMHYGIIQGLAEVHGLSTVRTVFAVVLSFLVAASILLFTALLL